VSLHPSRFPIRKGKLV